MSVTCLILAAGQSARFGKTDKLLAEVDGRPLIRHAVDEALASRSRDVHVIVQPDSTLLDKALAGLPVTLCINRDFASGIGSSIAVGIRSLAQDVTGVLILPADMPWMRADVLDALITAFECAGGSLVTLPVTADGEQRNPVLWPKSYFMDLCGLHADHGAKHLIPKDPRKLQKIVILDESGFQDVDTPEDLDP
jgi:molybdenum cofactor cytidylyltransferase